MAAVSTTRTLVLCALVASAAVAAAAAAAKAAPNTRPIIAIFSHPSTSTLAPCGGKCDYIAASYPKWIEAAGARAVPLGYYWRDAQVDALLDGRPCRASRRTRTSGAGDEAVTSEPQIGLHQRPDGFAYVKPAPGARQEQPQRAPPVA